MVVADDEVDAQTLGIGYLVDGLDTAVQYYDELDAFFGCIVQCLLTDTISLFVTIGNVIFDVRIELLQEFIHQSYRRTSIDVVVAVDHDALFAPHSIVEPVYSHVHVVHQERINQLVKHRTEETLSRALRFDASLNKEVGEYRTHADFLSKLLSRRLLF